MHTIGRCHVQVLHPLWVLLAGACLLWGGRGTGLAQHLDVAEVTNREYQAFLLATGREAPAHWDDLTFPPGTAEEPVTLVTWYDARDYCAWRGKRLPSQEEWQQACQTPAFRKHGDIWEWTQSGEAEWKVLCGPKGPVRAATGTAPPGRMLSRGFGVPRTSRWPGGRGVGVAPPTGTPPSSAA